MKVYILQSCDVEGCSIIDVFSSYDNAETRKKELLIKERAEMEEFLEYSKKQKNDYHIRCAKQDLIELEEDGKLQGGDYYEIGEYEVK